MITPDNFSSRYTSQVSDTSLLSCSSQKSIGQWILDGLYAFFKAIAACIFAPPSQSAPLAKPVAQDQPSGPVVAVVAKQALPKPPLPAPSLRILPAVVSQPSAIPAPTPKAKVSAKANPVIVSNAQNAIDALQKKLVELVSIREDKTNAIFIAKDEAETTVNDRELHMHIENALVYSSMIQPFTKEIKELKAKMDELERALRMYETSPNAQSEEGLNQLLPQVDSALEDPLQFNMD